MCLIYSPVSLSPSNLSVIYNIDNVFSWSSRGSQSDKYQIKILKNDDNTLTYDSGQIISANTYHTVPASTLSAGVNYKWQVQVWLGTSSAVSQYAFIASNSAPTIIFTDPNFASPPIVLPGQNYLFKALYDQAENISISKYRFILYDTDNNIIEDTGYIYGFSPEYEFDGMIRDSSYQIECIAVSQSNISCTTGKQTFSIASYTIPNTVPDIEILANDDNASIEVIWSDLKIVTPNVVGTYSYVDGKFDKGILLDDTTTIEYLETITPNDNILSGWYQFIFGQDGNFVQLGDHVFVGFDYNLQKFYIKYDSTYMYSQQFGLYTWENLNNDTWDNYPDDWRNPGFDPTSLTGHWFFNAITNTNTLTTYFDDVLAFRMSTGILVTTSYSSIKFTGKILLDNMRANNQSMLFAEIDNISKTTPQLWMHPTNWLADYEDSIEAGNINNDIPIIGWRLKRRKVTGELFVTLADLPKETRNFIDRTPANNIQYIYSVFSLSSEGEGLGLEAQAMVDFYGWYLIDNSTGAWFKFDAGWDGLQTDKIQTTQDIKIYKNFNETPTVSYGKQNYRSSKITAVPYVCVDNKAIINKAILDSVRLLITNKTAKILKNSFGDIMIVQTYNFDSQFQDKISTQPYQISFDWVEVQIYEENTQLPYGNSTPGVTTNTIQWRAWNPSSVWDSQPNGYTTARYIMYNNTVFFDFYLSATSGNNATTLTFDLPISPKLQNTKTNTTITEIVNSDHVFGASCEIDYTKQNVTVQSLSGISLDSPYELIVSGSYEV